MTTTLLSVLVVDDHPLFREGLVEVVRGMAGVGRVEEAADGAEAVATSLEMRPDVVVMDLHMPGTNGIEATRQILAELPETRVLVLTMLENDESVVSALRAGARGYIVKGAARAEIARAIEGVAAGDVVLGPAVGAKVLGLFNRGSDRGAGRVVPFPELTDRELEVLDLVARGLTNGAIARSLFLSEKTVRNIVSAIFGKLGVAHRAEAVARARDAGMGAG
ncbi:MAG: Two-component transcriptional response regulator, LuxR family [uncultured Nocardioides sp.]|uniref:Two-component transcriptional response regulator, LuxR family n=1 Tax=uncultured Nocardioides sp. TaxID=198441 RepID=A0A6J4P2A9_9ACTN|nr:MAG: Two-component transcriptional response regulator, LuxR family [uncultured Nocardioides sp.]